MKKLFFVLLAAGTITACNNSTGGPDSTLDAAKKTADTIKANADSAIKKIDSTATNAVDSIKAKASAATDSVKKAVKK